METKTTFAENYWAKTPIRMRKIGDAILIGTASLSAMMMGAPLSEAAKTWVIFVLNVVGVAGKIISNMFKDVPPEAEPLNKGEGA